MIEKENYDAGGRGSQYPTIVRWRRKQRYPESLLRRHFTWAEKYPEATLQLKLDKNHLNFYFGPRLRGFYFELLRINDGKCSSDWALTFNRLSNLNNRSMRAISPAWRDIGNILWRITTPVLVILMLVNRAESRPEFDIIRATRAGTDWVIEQYAINAGKNHYRSHFDSWQNFSYLFPRIYIVVLTPQCVRSGRWPKGAMVNNICLICLCCDWVYHRTVLHYLVQNLPAPTLDNIATKTALVISQHDVLCGL